MAQTRRTLERIPDDRLDYKPHPKSWAMGGLATHVATIPMWAEMTVQQDSIDIGGTPPQEPLGSRKEILERFDRNVAASRAAIAAAEDARLLAPWSLLMNGQTVFTMPRTAVLRTFVMNHIIHHRAQLGVYLRMNDVPVPAIYGPSADEQGM
jgi:uncharacterized damage-inducible protein DinB